MHKRSSVDSPPCSSPNLFAQAFARHRKYIHEWSLFEKKKKTKKKMKNWKTQGRLEDTEREGETERHKTIRQLQYLPIITEMFVQYRGKIANRYDDEEKVNLPGTKKQKFFIIRSACITVLSGV